MVNRWTGAYDAVIELGPDGANRLLAAIHRKGNAPADQPEDGPHLMHSIAVNLPLNGPIAGRNLRGSLQAQVSTPSVSVPGNTDGTRVTVSTEIYTWFQRARGSDPAPEFLHGTLALTVGLRTIECQDEVLVEVRLDGLQASFTPAVGSGASAADVALVESVVPSIVADSIAPVHLHVGSLSAGGFSVRQLDFKSLQQGAGSAFALLLGLRAPSGPAPTPAGVNEVFLAPGDQAAVAIGREFLTSVLFEKAQGPLAGVSVSGSRFRLHFDAHLEPASLRLELQPGRLHLSVDGAGSASIVGSFRFRLALNFGLAVEQGQLVLSLASGTDLDITSGGLPGVIFGLFRGRIIDAIEDAAGDTIDAVNSELNTVVDDSVRGLLEELAIDGVGLRFTRAAIDPDALILAATVDIGGAPPVFARFRRLDQPAPSPSEVSNAFGVDLVLSAFESWIPGGTLRRFLWRETRHDGSVARSQVETHRFVAKIGSDQIQDAGGGATAADSSSGSSTGSTGLGLSLGVRSPSVLPVLTGTSLEPASLGWPPTVWCLEVQGTQVLSGDGPPATVSGRICVYSVVVADLDVLQAERLPVLVSDGNGGALATIDPWGSFRPHSLASEREQRGLLLVHHSGPDAEAGAAALRRALPRPGRGPLVFATLVSEGLRGKLPAGAGIAYTHDPEKRWRQRFGLADPGTVLIGPGGRELWRGKGPLRAEELAKVLAGLPPSRPRPPRRVQLGLALGLGEVAPDLLFPCGGERLIALRKMGGREAVVCFWTTWSEPALEELRRLAAGRSEDPRAPLILCVNDGEDPALAARVLQGVDARLKLIPDPDRSLSRRYGVTCWPTVVRLDGRGRVADVRLGLDPTASGCPGPGQEDPAQQNQAPNPPPRQNPPDRPWEFSRY